MVKKQDFRLNDQSDMPDRDLGPRRALSSVLLQRTLAITLLLGLVAAAATTWVDLIREKNAVEKLARDFMSSASPSAAAAAYNYDQAAAEQVAEGLFLERAITGIRIVNEGEVMVDEQREVAPTLPQVGIIGSADVVMLTKTLYEPNEDANTAPIGELSITVDKSLVPPEIVDRLLTYFVVTTAKNVLFGLFLYWMVFSVLARHISALTRMTQMWQPGTAAVKFPAAPKFLQRTEVEGLGQRIEQLTEMANSALDVIQRSHDAVVNSNAELSDAVRNRTKELEKVNSRLKHMADRDGLTGLYNRAYFDQFLANAYETASNAGTHLEVLLIDVDHFKAFNDFYGHQAGDEALVCVADILSRIQDETGCMMARYGGEEFIGLFSSNSPSYNTLAESIHDALKEAAIEHQHSTTARRITVSIGTASTAEEGFASQPSVLILAADDALYKAKNSGRNRTVVSTPEIRADAQEQRASVQALLEAIDAEEFEPYLQPQVDARTGQLVGVEALVRWVRSDGCVVPPAKFMPTAEQTGLIKRIDAIVLKQIGKMLSAYPGALPRLSVNVTGDSFANDSYFEDILKLEAASDNGITVELLETAFIDRPDDHFLWQLDTLREAGIQIEIDDFGTGRTSILGLMAISPNRLKIARELILPLGYRGEQSKLVTSVVEIANSLGMSVLAEGVESKETAHMLVDIGCPIQQGYYHGKPMPAAELVKRYVTPLVAARPGSGKN